MALQSQIGSVHFLEILLTTLKKFFIKRIQCFYRFVSNLKKQMMAENLHKT